MFKAQVSGFSSIILILVLLSTPLFLKTEDNKRFYQKEFLEKSFNELLQTKLQDISLIQTIILNTCENSQINQTNLFNKYFDQKKYLIKINQETYTNSEELITNKVLYKDQTLNKQAKLKTYCNQDLEVSLTLL